MLKPFLLTAMSQYDGVTPIYPLVTLGGRLLVDIDNTQLTGGTARFRLYDQYTNELIITKRVGDTVNGLFVYGMDWGDNPQTTLIIKDGDVIGGVLLPRGPVLMGVDKSSGYANYQNVDDSNRAHVLDENYIYKLDTYTDGANGTTQKFELTTDAIFACSKYSLQVKGTGAAADDWIVYFQISIDGTNWTTILTHNLAEGDGAIITTGANLYPAIYGRTVCDSVTLGGATNIKATFVAMK